MAATKQKGLIYSPVCSIVSTGRVGGAPRLLNKRMAVKTLTLWLLLLGTVLSLGSGQHWSFGLSPGGKRELDGFPNTLDGIFEGFAHMDAPCSVLGCAEESLPAKIYRMKGLLGSISEREHGHQPFEK